MRWRYFVTLHGGSTSIELKELFQDVDSIGPGEICAVFGIECASGDTFTDGTTQYSMTSMFVPDPVISLSIKPEGVESPNFSRALNRFQKEDPTFRIHVDAESQEVRPIFISSRLYSFMVDHHFWNGGTSLGDLRGAHEARIWCPLSYRETASCLPRNYHRHQQIPLYSQETDWWCRTVRQSHRSHSTFRTECRDWQGCRI